MQYLPSPVDIADVVGTDPDDKTVEITRAAKDEEPFTALAFKIISDPHGTLSFIRVYSGTIEAGANILNPRTGKTNRLGRLIKMHANREKKSIA